MVNTSKKEEEKKDRELRLVHWDYVKETFRVCLLLRVTPKTSPRNYSKGIYSRRDAFFEREPWDKNYGKFVRTWLARRFLPESPLSWGERNEKQVKAHRGTSCRVQMMELDASNGHSANNQCTHFQICRINIGDFIADTRERERERERLDNGLVSRSYLIQDTNW